MEIWNLARWTYGVTRLALLAHLLPRWLVVMFAVAELDAIVDWRQLAREAWSQPPQVVGTVVGVACLLAGLDARRLVDATLRGPPLAVLRRQPVDPLAWGAASFVLTGPLVLWLAVLAGFLTGLRPGPMLLWSGLALAAVAAGSGRDRLLASAGAGLVAAAAHATGAALGCALVVWAGALPLAGRWLLASAHDGPDRGSVTSVGRARDPLAALVHRDALLLWRTERSLVASLAVSPLGVGLTAGLMVRTGDWASPAVTAGVVVLLVPASVAGLQALAAVARGLGRRFDPPEWPVTAAQRTGSLAVLVGGLLVPSWAAAAVTAPRIGLGHLQIGAFVAAVALGAAWWVAARPSRPDAGAWPYWLAACLGAVLAPGGVLWGALLAGLAWGGASAALERRRGRP